MHFGVCFFCVLLASGSFVTAMPLPFFRNVLEPQEVKYKNGEDFFTAQRIILPEGSMSDSIQNEGDNNSLYKSSHITNNAGNSLNSAYRGTGSSNKAVKDDSASFSSLYLSSPKLNSPSKRTVERNVEKGDYPRAYVNALVHDGYTNNLMKKLRGPDAAIESPSVTIPASELKYVAHGTANLKNIPSIMSPEMMKPADDNLWKPYEERQNTPMERKSEGRQESTSRDEVASDFSQQVTSQLNYQKQDEKHPLDEGELDRGPLRRKQRNTGVFWRKRDIPVFGSDTSGMLGVPEEENFLQDDMYGLESSTQFSFVPNQHGISYLNGRETHLDIDGINSPEISEDNKYVQNLPLNSFQSNEAVQNDPSFQLSRPYNHYYQRLSSLTNSENDIPSNTYHTPNNYQSEIVPELPAEPSDYLTSSSDEDTMSFNKYLSENDNIGFNSQEVLPHEEEIKYLSDNHDRDYEKKYSYNDEMSNILDQNDLSIYPGLYKHNSYVGDNVVSSLSDSYPSERDKYFAYNNYRKTNNFPNNKSQRDYSSNRDIQEKYEEGDNNVGNNRDYYYDLELPNSVEQRYSYNYPETSREILDSRNYQGVPSQLLYNPDINEMEMRNSDDFSPVNSMSQSKSADSSPSFGHFTSNVRPTGMGSNLPRNLKHDLRSNIRKNLYTRYKNPRQYVSVRRNSQVSPYNQDSEFAEFHPKQHRAQDSMVVYDYTDSASDNKNQTNKKTERKLQNESEMSCTNVSEKQMAQKRHSTGANVASYRRLHSEKRTEVTFDPLKCLEEAEPTENESTETTTLSLVTESNTEEHLKEAKGEKEVKEEKPEKEEKENTTQETKSNRTTETTIYNAVPVCKTDFPCSVDGVWYSHTGGVLLSLQANKGGKLNVHILKTPSYYKGHGILSGCWNITGEMPFHPGMKSFISLKAIENIEHKFATFLGECFTCEGVDVIYGSWLLGRPALSCSDQHISTIEYKDVFKKSYMHALGKNCKKKKRKPHG